MQTLKSSGEIKEFLVDNIIFNLPKVNVTSVTLLKNNVNLNVKAQSENITLNIEYRALYPENITGGAIRFFDYYNPEIEAVCLPVKLEVTE